MLRTLSVPFIFKKGSSCCSVKPSTYIAGDSAGDVDSIPGSGRSPGEGNGSPLQYSCPENPIGRVAWRATVHGVAKESDTT